MRLGSVLIGGDEWKPLTLVPDFEIVNETGGNYGTARFKVLYDPAAIGASIIEPGDAIIITATGGEGGESDQLFGDPLFGDPLFGEGESTQNIFRGNVVSVEPAVMVIAGLGTDPVNVMLVEAVNRMTILEAAQVEAAEYSGDTDDVIIADVFGAVAPTVDLTYVNSTTTLATFTRHDESLRAMMERLREQTGAVMWMGAEEAPDFHSLLPASNPAPFSFSDNPDDVASFPCDRARMHVRRDWRTPANSVTVLGAVVTGGVRVRVTVTDATSIATYGVKGRTIVDPQITSEAEATLRGNVELERDANPQYSGTLITRYEGIEVGMLLTLDFDETLNFSGDFVVTRVTQRWVNRNITESTIEWGLYRPNEAALLRQLAEMAKHPGAVLPGQPAPGTVGTGTIIPGSVTGGSGGSIASATITNLNVGNAAIEEANIANLAVSEAKIQNASISTAKIQNLAVTNALINDLAAGKINTGDLLVGGSGKVGQVTVYDASNTAFGWIGKSGSDYGAWFAQIRAGGTNWSNARLRVANGGAITLALVDSDSFVLTSTTFGLTTTINGSGLLADSASSNSVTNDSAFVAQWSGGASSPRSQVSVAASESFIAALFDGAAGSKNVKLSSTTSLSCLIINSNVLVRETKTGWTAPTGTSTRSGFATSTVTTEVLAQHVKALMEDLRSHHGLIGA